MRDRVLTKCNDVAHETEDSHVELSVLDVRTTTDKGHGNRHCVANSQADNTNTRESVECSRGSEVQDTEDDLDCHTEHHGIEWDIKLRVDNLPPLETWDGSITGESPCGAGSGSGASNAAEEGEDHKRDTQGECASLAADCLYNDDGCWLTGSEVEEILKIWEDEEKRDKEDKSTDGVENDGSDHGLRNLYARVLHFFAHANSISVFSCAQTMGTYEIIMPVEEVAYAACKRPTQKAHPGVQPDKGSNSVKTNFADRLPSLASARTQTIMAITPAKVQKMANV